MGLSDTFPVHLVASEVDPEGRVVLLRPKFIHPWFKWLQRLQVRPFFRVTLDEVGSRLWQACDGTRSLVDIYALLRSDFGEQVEPVEERAGYLLQKMSDGGFIRLEVRI